MPSVFDRISERLANRLQGASVVAPEAGCPIGWQPSVFTPVFYGISEHTLSFHEVPPVLAQTVGAPVKDRLELPSKTVRFLIFYPSLDGSPANAPILSGCGRYPLVVFAHGNCGESEHFRKWYELPATLARCGNVVIVPELPGTNLGTFPSQNNEEVGFLTRVVAWARNDWDHRKLLMDDPATGLVGHSFGAALTGRVVVENLIPVTAHASLSGTYPAGLRAKPIPKLATWGTGGEDLLVPIENWESTLANPAHVAEIHGSGHWDYLPQGRSTCNGQRGQCTLVPALAADVVALFFGRYMPPERWATVNGTPWLPWFRVPVSLRPPPLLLTQEQKFFAGGQFAAWPLLANRAECGISLSWKTSSSSGTVTVG